MTRFVRYENRTTNVELAQKFYSELFQGDLFDAGVIFSTLPEKIRAMGAPSHWLGYIGIEDVSRFANGLVNFGAQKLGPVADSFGHAIQIMRDPFGAVVALNSQQLAPSQNLVRWHLHHSRDHVKAIQVYSQIFSWAGKQVTDYGPENGLHQEFSWDANDQPAGSFTNAALQPHIHPQWLFFFEVLDLEQSMGFVTSQGGIVLKPIDSAKGYRVVACDDPFGAAFGLIHFVK